MNAYHVNVTREGAQWLADGPGGAHTFAKNLVALDRHIREAIAVALDLPEEAEAGLVIEYEYRLGDAELDAAATALRAERKRLIDAEQDLTERTAQVAARLVKDLSVRDTAIMLAISPQRVSQIAPRQAS